MKAEVHWTGGSKMACFNAAKDQLDMDWNDGPSPMQVMLQAIGACTIADIVTGLKDRAFSEVWLELESERRQSRLDILRRYTWCTTCAGRC